MSDREQLPVIRWPVPKNNRNGEFGHLEEVLAHLEGEYSGHWLIGRNGMWHGGLHITDTTTPWCALSGQGMNEAVDFPVPYQGEQAVRCMVDGEVVAYRINQDYLSASWFTGDLFYSGSFVLVRHRIQPGKTAESGLSFYTLYMHLAPWLAYQEQDNTTFKVADGQHLKAYVDASLQWVAAQLPAGTRVTWDTTAKADTMTGSNGRQYAHVTLDEPVMGNMSLNAGDRVWTVCDKGNLVPAHHSPARPVWWTPLLPPSRETMQFDTVVCPTPYPIKAGDPVGHLGYFQVPSESGYEKRYQVHIECLTPDDLPRFLSNPEGVGRDTPAFARCPAGIPVYLKNTAGNLRDSQVKNLVEVVMPLSGQVVKDTDGKRYWPGGASRGLLAEADLRLLSRYDLAGRGFETTEDSPASFDHLDGKTQPKGLVRHIFQTLFTASSADPRSSHALVKHNYQRLLDKVDSDDGKGYSTEEYRRAVQNQDYRAHLYNLCVKHPSDWYYSSEAPVWKSYFTPQLKKEAPEWYRYGEKFLTDLRWMHRVAGMVENPWHLHPLVFLDAIRSQAKTLEGKLTYNAEGNDIPSSIYYSRVIHWPGNDLSGVTLGRGYDMGDRSENDIYNDMVASGISNDQAVKISKCAGIKGAVARDYVSAHKKEIGEITLQQQESLFSIIYPKYVERTIVNYNKWTSGVSSAKQWEELDASIQEVLVDFVYQGFTKGPKPMLAGANDSKKELIDYIKNTPAISQYEPGRHRAYYLEGSK